MPKQQQLPPKIPPPATKPEITNIVEQAPFIGFLLDELIQEQKTALVPLIEAVNQVRQEVAQVKKELQDRRDVGEYRITSANATTQITSFDYIRDFGFPIKGYVLSNDGNNTIQIGHLSSLHTSASVDFNDERFFSVLSSDNPFPMIYDVPCIRRIDLRTTAGTSDYRLWIMW